MSRLSPRRRITLGIAVMLASGALGLLVLELGLRWVGFRPWHAVVYGNEPVMNEPDPVLGWRSKEGVFIFPGYARGSLPVRMTYLSDGSRITGRDEPRGLPKVVLLGGSYTQGWAVSDDETYAWKLQERFPRLHVVNYGTAGYGTYQSLLLLERLFSEEDPPQYVVYGFIEHHELRNVGAARWQWRLARYSRRGTVKQPYATLGGKGEIVRHPPEEYPYWPLREHLAFMSLLNLFVTERLNEERDAERRAVTGKLLVQMDQLSRGHDASFLVVLFDFSAQEVEREYTRFFQKRRIRYVDCAFPIDEGMRVQGEGHPNGFMHTRWADCVEAGLAAELEASP